MGRGKSQSSDLFFKGLSLWDVDGKRIDAGEVLSATTLVSNSEGIDKARWTVAIQDLAGETLSIIAERMSQGILSVIIEPNGSSRATAMSICLPVEPDEHFYGLGERFDHFDLTGYVIKNRTAEEAGLRTTYVPATFLLSSRGYGLHVETMGHITFDLRTIDRGHYWTDEIHQGPGQITVCAPLYEISPFIRQGSDLDLSRPDVEARSLENWTWKGERLL